VEFNKIVEQCFYTLTEFCVGPCKANQTLLCWDRKLLMYINENILGEEYRFTSNSSKNGNKVYSEGGFNDDKRVSVL